MKNRILIVDDEPVIRNLFTRVLSPCGYVAVLAEGVREANLAIHNDAFDLLITDLSLQDGSGVDVVRMFREKDGNAPVLIVTGSLTAGARQQMLQGLSNCYCLMKPVEVRELKSVVAELLPL